MNLESALGVGLFPNHSAILQTSNSNSSYAIADSEADGPPDILLPVWGQWLNTRDALSVVEDRLEIEEMIRSSNSAELFLYYSEYLPGRGHKDELWENEIIDAEEYIDYTPIIDRYEPWHIEDKDNVLYSQIQEEDFPFETKTIDDFSEETENNEETMNKEKATTEAEFIKKSKSSYSDLFFISEAIDSFKKSLSPIRTPLQTG